MRYGRHPECDSGAEVGSTIRQEHAPNSARLNTCVFGLALLGPMLVDDKGESTRPSRYKGESRARALEVVLGV